MRVSLASVWIPATGLEESALLALNLLSNNGRWLMASILLCLMQDPFRLTALTGPALQVH